jgi:hypothetical protein
MDGEGKGNEGRRNGEEGGKGRRRKTKNAPRTCPSTDRALSAAAPRTSIYVTQPIRTKFRQAGASQSYIRRRRGDMGKIIHKFGLPEVQVTMSSNTE